MSDIDEEIELPRISTGNRGLDDILDGGFDPNRMYLYEGRPGCGKTTLALQFLLEGARRGEQGLYVTLSETRRELGLVARRHAGPWTASTCSRSIRDPISILRNSSRCCILPI